MNTEEFLKLNLHNSDEKLLAVQADSTFINLSNNSLSININTANGIANSGSIVQGNNYRIIYAWPNAPYTSYTTVRIDGKNYIYGLDGVQVKKPTIISSTEAESSWKIGDIQVTQNVRIVTNPYTGKNDIGYYSYTAKNLGTVNHSVGIRIMHDTMIRNNIAPDYVVANSSSPLQYETAFTGSKIPSYFKAYERFPQDLNTASLGILKGFSSTNPSKVVFARYSNVANNPWDITLSNTVRGVDNAVGIYFGEYTLAQNVSFRTATLYGLGAEVSIPFEDNITLTTSEESCIIDTTATVDVEAASNIFAYKYSYNENDCNNESLVRGDVIGFTLVFGNYGPLDYTASTSENTIVDTLSIPSPMNLEVVSISMSSDLLLLDLTTGKQITVGTVLESGEHSIQILKLLIGGQYSGAFDIDANTVYSISMLVQIQF